MDREKSHDIALKTKEALERANQELVQNQQLIRELMLTDPLTGVPNRRHLDERMQVELERVQRYGRPLSVLIADLDHFKTVNDSHGRRSR